MGENTGSGSSGLSHHLQVLKAAWSQDREEARTRRTIDETAFLPAALEVMETPPSPFGRGLLWFLVSCIVIALIWSFVGRLDVVAIAPGKLVPEDRVKIVQAPELGIVRALNVKDGDRVKAGDVLVELDPTDADAEAGQADRSLLAAQIDAARAQAVIDGVNGGSGRVVAPQGAPEDVVRTQQTLVAAQLAEYRARLAGLSEQRASAEARSRGAVQERAGLERSRPLLERQAATTRRLADQGIEPRMSALEQETRLNDLNRNIAVARETEGQARADIAAASQQTAEARQQVLRTALDELADAKNRIALARGDHAKAGRRAGTMRLVAPVDGTVQQIKLTTLGAVVQPAEALMTVVPDAQADGAGDMSLVAEVAILNRDAGFVREGQEVALKLEAFPFTDYGIIPATLTQIGRDAVEQEGVGLVYPARASFKCSIHKTIGLTRSERQLRNICAQATSGMTVTAEVKTATRRVIDYLLSPIAKAIDEAGRER